MKRHDQHLETLGLTGWPLDGDHVSIHGEDPVLASSMHLAEAAAVALALGGASAAELHRLRGAPAAAVDVNVAHAAASLIGFALQTRVDGTPDRDLMRARPATVGFFRARHDRHIHLHGGFPALHAGTLSMLGCEDGEEAIARAVSRWDAFDLEDALAEAGLCGAVVRTPDEWDEHPQAQALRARPVVSIERIGDAPVRSWASSERPLSGVRVLDLTRVLAGPTSGRTLAQYGADVLRIGASRLPSIPAFVHETGHGKRSAFLDLDVPEERARLDALIDGADVFTDGFRGGSLAARGLSSETLAQRRPGIVHVNIRCYGDQGPFADRRGWEQLAQSTTGIAWITGSGREPRLLPAAATDYTTGYLAAFGAIEALRRRALEGGSWRVEVSLCRTAMWLRDLGVDLDPAAATGLPALDAIRIRSKSPDGDVLHVSPAVSLSTCAVEWRRAAAPLGSDRPEWLPREEAVPPASSFRDG